MPMEMKSELLSVLRQYNPWWGGGRPLDLPSWRRSAFNEIKEWLVKPPAARAVILSGTRQIGKTTLLLQCIDDLLASGISPSKILYATFDHPILKRSGLDELLDLWHEIEPEKDGVEYIFLDEIQYMKDWQTWLKLQVDFHKRCRIAVTGSATPLSTEGQESGVGRWHTVRLSTLSFSEYLQIKGIAAPKLPAVSSLNQLFDWKAIDFLQAGEEAKPLVGHFYEYLVRGGFPQTAQMESISMAQRLLREDIIDKILRRDMTAMFGVRRVQELEQTFLYLCMHDGGLLDMVDLCGNLSVKKPTAISFINLLESTHLIYKLPPFGYGKEILRARYKVYLADAAISSSVLLKGKSLLEDPAALGAAVETAVFKHVFTCFQSQGAGFSYWRGGKKDYEVDIIAEVEGGLAPFEVKYREQATGAGELKGMQEFCAAKKVARGYVATKSMSDFSLMPLDKTANAPIMLKIPAPLLCYWLGSV